MAMDRDSTLADAARAAEAFKTVALTWMARNQVRARPLLRVALIGLVGFCGRVGAQRPACQGF